MQIDIQGLKRALPLPTLIEQLGISERVRRTMFCPFHDNKLTEAFSVYRGTKGGWKWKCHAGCGGGDEIDFIERLHRASRKEAIERYRQLLGSQASYPNPKTAITPKTQPSRDLPCIKLPDDVHEGSHKELEAVAKIRRVGIEGVAMMQKHGILLFGTVCRQRCWLITDASRQCVEARRLDGLNFPAFPGGSERKAHTLRGSSKGWPVGVMLRNHLHEEFSRILLHEGSGDIVAGYHLIHAAGKQGATWLPVTMLGASTHIHPRALRYLTGKSIRIVPHVDESGGNGAKRWAKQLSAIGCDVSGFSLNGLRRSDGSKVKDLNDCTDIHFEDAAELEGLLK